MVMVKPRCPTSTSSPTSVRRPSPRRGLQRERGVRDACRGRAPGRARHRARGADRHPPRRRRHHRHLPREGRRPVAGRGVTAAPKVRSRKDGGRRRAGRPRQAPAQSHAGSVPARAARPYAAVAHPGGGLRGGGAGARRGRLVDHRIIREITPIYDTRALGYSSMLVAAKVDAEHPQRPAQVINQHPGVSHNYLRDHEFNLWFTLAVEADRGSGSRARSRSSSASAPSIRQLPTLKLFKIRMDLEMEKGTEALATAAEAAEPAETERQPYDEVDIEVIRATQGKQPVVAEPYAEPGEAPGHARRSPARTHGGHDRAASAAPGGGDPLPPPRRLLGQRHGRLGGPRGPDPRARPAHGFRARRLPLLPAPHLSPTGPTRSSRWPTAARRRSATPSSTRSPR